MDECDNECDTEVVSLTVFYCYCMMNFFKYLFELSGEDFNCHLWPCICESFNCWD